MKTIEETVKAILKEFADAKRSGERVTHKRALELCKRVTSSTDCELHWNRRREAWGLARTEWLTERYDRFGCKAASDAEPCFTIAPTYESPHGTGNYNDTIQAWILRGPAAIVSTWYRGGDWCKSKAEAAKAMSKAVLWSRMDTEELSKQRVDRLDALLKLWADVPDVVGRVTKAKELSIAADRAEEAQREADRIAGTKANIYAKAGAAAFELLQGLVAEDCPAEHRQACADFVAKVEAELAKVK